MAIKLDKTNITADKLYTDLKSKYAKYELLDIIDSTILYNKYEMTDEDQETIKSKADEYIKYYEENYQMTKEDFLSKNNFESYEEFVEYLKLDYLRQKYYDEYLTGLISEDDIKKYYDEEVIAPFTVEHILVKTGSDNKEEKEELATEILDKLKDGEEWDDLKKEYEDDIVTEEFDIEFDSSLEDAFITAAKKLSDGEYTGSLVTTNYGYHIILRKETKEIPELDEIKARILTVLKTNYVNENKNVYEKSLIKLREDSGLNIKDTELAKVYDKYKKDYE